jgi:hypothetical protein
MMELSLEIEFSQEVPPEFLDERLGPIGLALRDMPLQQIG